MRVVDAEVTGVDFVHTVSAVEIGERCDAGADPTNGQSIFASLYGTIVGVLFHIVREELI